MHFIPLNNYGSFSIVTTTDNLADGEYPVTNNSADYGPKVYIDPYTAYVEDR